jgi:hypothetical protein
MDCSVFGVTEGPDKHIMVISKNGTDSLIVSEMVPQYVGIKEHGKNSKLTINPNPTSDKLTLSQIPDGAENFEIFDNLGIKVSEGLLGKEIDISFLPVGIYFLKLNNTAKPLKFIK